MQIPRWLKLQRKTSVKNTNGHLKVDTHSISNESWLAKNYWFLQFSILIVAVTGRILFYNADPVGLITLTSIIVISALLMGYLFAGKTWCHYICPMSPVQKFYSGTSAVFENKAHLQKGNITQSMCRTKNEESNCVACRTDCPDIDLEKNYWSEVEVKGRRLFYYGFPGLIIGYYLFYFLYSGNLQYIFTGQSVKEYNQLANLFAPGIYFNQTLYAIPKIIAAPMVIIISIATTYSIGIIAQKIYRQIRIRQGMPLSNKEYLHYSFIVSVFLSFNIFYLFSARASLALLPEQVVYLFDFSIVSFSAIWAVKSFSRSALEYKIESVGNALRENIKNSPINWKDVLDNRSVVDLSLHEIYALARVMPKINKQQTHKIYKDALKEVFYRDELDDENAMAVIYDIQKRFNISQNQHESILQEIKNERIMVQSL